MPDLSIQHVSVIMDGNGRWATERGRPRVWGHVRGSEVVTKIVESASSIGLKGLTLYAFSTENWKRPPTEIKVLFSLLKKYIIKECQNILKNNIRFRVIGSLSKIPESTRSLVRKLEEDSKNNTGLKLNFAFDYGGRSEIVEAVNSFIKNNPSRSIDETKLEQYLYTSDLGDVDLMIRTSGEQRISNFLLWQSAYAEFYFTNTKWPDFTPQMFEEIIQLVSQRERRFGKISQQIKDGK